MPRRTKQERADLADALYDIVSDLQPMTIRSLFYRAVSAGIVAKTELEYKLIVRITGELRKQRVMPYHWLVDAGRFARKANLWDSPKKILSAVRRQYRYNHWLKQPKQVEVWVEKDAIVGVIEDTTDSYGVALYSCKGYPSLSMIHNAIMSWDRDKEICIRYFGDHDPSGADIPRYVQEAIAEMNPFINLDFEVKAVTEDQIDEYDLPTRPTKSSDSRSANFYGESVEVDAFSPDDLRELVSRSIADEIDDNLWQEAEELEEKQHEQLKKAIDSINL